MLILIMDIISQLKKSGLKGRSGSGFPTGLKWETAESAKGKQKYVICNVSEGEPGVFKDGFILDNFPTEMVDGIKLALRALGGKSSAFIYLRKDYYKKFKGTLSKIIKKDPIHLFEKKGSYIAGEETSVISAIEGKKAEPRIRPPYPTEQGLFGFPTLVNNAETFYWASRIAAGGWRGERFYCLDGEVKNKGVFQLSEDYTVRKILQQSGNYPDFDFFVQAGGGACGEILLPHELDQKVKGIGSIIVFNRKKTNVLELMKKWAEFFVSENCDKCVPCREGTYRIVEILQKDEIDRELLEDVLFTMERSSFCPLGRIAVTPFRGVVSKLLDNGR